VCFSYDRVINLHPSVNPTDLKYKILVTKWIAYVCVRNKKRSANKSWKTGIVILRAKDTGLNTGHRYGMAAFFSIVKSVLYNLKYFNCPADKGGKLTDLQNSVCFHSILLFLFSLCSSYQVMVTVCQVLQYYYTTLLKKYLGNITKCSHRKKKCFNIPGDIVTNHWIYACKCWRNGYSVGLGINRSRVQILLQAMLHNNLEQVVHTYVPLSPSSITWYQPKGSYALWLGR